MDGRISNSTNFTLEQHTAMIIVTDAVFNARVSLASDARGGNRN